MVLVDTVGRIATDAGVCASAPVKQGLRDQGGSVNLVIVASSGKTLLLSPVTMDESTTW